MFQRLSREHGFQPLRIEGRIPPELRGTLYRNGPGQYSVLGRDYGHWFDGDGAVTAIRIRDGRGWGAARFVQSAGLMAEQRLCRPLYGGYGTCPPGPITRQTLESHGLPTSKQVANSAIFSWQGRLFALGDQGLPTELDPRDLSTIGEADLDGVVTTSFSSHPRIVEERGAAYNFGLRYQGGTELHLYELPSAGRPRRIRKVQLEAVTVIHDFAVTRSHAVFFVAPVRLRPLEMVLGLQSFERSLEWRPSDGTEVVIIPLDGDEPVTRLTVEPFHHWHMANAFDDGDDIVVDYVRYRDFSSNDDLRRVQDGILRRPLGGTLHRARIDRRRAHFRSDPCSDISCEFPRVAPGAVGRRHQWIYANVTAPTTGVSASFFNQLAVFSPDSGSTELVSVGEGMFPSEPIFIPSEGSGRDRDGWLMSLVYDARTHTSHLAVLDAADVGGGPVARLHFDHHVPPTFHGSWIDGQAAFEWGA
jgi:all-trans-8'-apo-beta-carotenal 15,15'-oxygenase